MDSWNRNLGVLILPVVAVPTVAKAFAAAGVMTDQRAKRRLTDSCPRPAGTVTSLG